MKIMIVGDWQWPQYEIAFKSSIERLGHQVITFKIKSNKKNRVLEILSYLPFFSNLNDPLNKKIIFEAEKSSPEYILFWKPVKIQIRTLLFLKKRNIKVLSYNNDCAFPNYKYHKSAFIYYIKWIQYKRCISYFDINFVYRVSDTQIINALGSKKTEIIMPYFIPSVDKRVNCIDSEILKYKSDVVFIGHYEDDGRDRLVRSLYDNNVDVAIWGSEQWANSKYLIGTKIYRGSSLLGLNYRKALSSSKIGLCFLSKLNRDEYTRRNFEIPATQTLLLSERTDTLCTLFKENVEAVFFSDESELINKVHILLSDDNMRTSIAKAGHKRIWNSGYDIDSIVMQFLETISAK